MIRLILALLFAILYLIIGIPVLGVEWIIAKFNKQAADLGQLRMVQWAFRVILFICGTKVTVIGEENVPKDQAVSPVTLRKRIWKKCRCCAPGCGVCTVCLSTVRM